MLARSVAAVGNDAVLNDCRQLLSGLPTVTAAVTALVSYPLCLGYVTAAAHKSVKSCAAQ
jgi:hypothetical protein